MGPASYNASVLSSKQGPNRTQRSWLTTYDYPSINSEWRFHIERHFFPPLVSKAFQPSGPECRGYMDKPRVVGRTITDAHPPPEPVSYSQRTNDPLHHTGNEGDRHCLSAFRKFIIVSYRCHRWKPIHFVLGKYTRATLRDGLLAMYRARRFHHTPRVMPSVTRVPPRVMMKPQGTEGWRYTRYPCSCFVMWPTNSRR